MSKNSTQFVHRIFCEHLWALKNGAKNPRSPWTALSDFLFQHALGETLLLKNRKSPVNMTQTWACGCLQQVYLTIHLACRYSQIHEENQASRCGGSGRADLLRCLVLILFVLMPEELFLRFHRRSSSIILIPVGRLDISALGRGAVRPWSSMIYDSMNLNCYLLKHMYVECWLKRVGMWDHPSQTIRSHAFAPLK